MTKLLYALPEATNTGPGFNRESGGGARGNGVEKWALRGRKKIKRMHLLALLLDRPYGGKIPEKKLAKYKCTPLTRGGGTKFQFAEGWYRKKWDQRNPRRGAADRNRHRSGFFP